MRASIATGPRAGGADFAAARDYCRNKFPDFYFAATFLPKKKRLAAWTAAAFCGLVAEALSQQAEPDAALELLRERLDEIYSGKIQTPKGESRDPQQHIVAAMTDVAPRHSIPRSYFLDLAAGVRLDQTAARYATWNSLQKYLECTGGVAALILCAVAGLKSSQAGAQMARLGQAIRFTHLLRDLPAHAQRGKIFLPLEDLVRFGCGEKDLLAGKFNDSMREMMKFQVARARGLYAEGAEGICWLADDGSRLAGAVMACLAEEMLRKIQRRGFDVSGSPITLTAGQRLRQLPAAWKLARATGY